MPSSENVAGSAAAAAATPAVSVRTFYHLLFSRLLLQKGPKNVTFSFDQQLTVEPQRADVIIMRKVGSDALVVAEVLRRLWAWLSIATVGEYKSPERPLRKGDLSKLLGYGAQYHASEAKQLTSSRDLTMALFVASWTPTLDDELAVFGWTAEPLGDGYFKVNAQPYVLYIAVLDKVSEAERDVLLDLVGHHRMDSREADLWLLEQASGIPEGLTMADLEGYDELMSKYIERLPDSVRLKGMKPAQRLAGLEPEERLQGLGLDDQILALSDDVLATFPPRTWRRFPHMFDQRSNGG